MTERFMTVQYRINGEDHIVAIEPDDLLLDIIRKQIGLTGTKYNCRQGECGACTIIMDGVPINSCLILAAVADGSEITTIEGLGRGGRPDVVQDAFIRHDGSQCGYCTPGMIMSARALLDANPSPDREEILEGLAGNLCRCTGYKHIIDAVEDAAQRLSK